MRRSQKIVGDAVGEKCLAYARVSVNEKIVVFVVEIPDKTFCGVICGAGGLLSSQAGSFVFYSIRIPVKRKVVKVFELQNIFQRRLGIEEIHFRFFEAGAFSAVHISGVAAQWTGMRKLQIIGRIAVFNKDSLLLCLESFDPAFKIRLPG